MNPTTRTILIAALLIGAGACGATDRPTEAVFRVDTLASGARVASNSGPGAWAGPEGRPWRLEQLERFGGREDTAASFSTILDLEFGPDSMIYLADLPGTEVDVYSIGGALVRSFGRAGEGPGELGRIGAIGFLSEAVVGVSDAELRRLSFFSRTGDFIRSTPLDFSPGRFRLGTGRFLGRRYADLTQFASRSRRNGRLLVTYPYIGLKAAPNDRGGAAPDSIVVERWTPEAGAARSRGRVVSGSPAPFSARQVLAVATDPALLVARGDEYRVHRISVEGDTLLTFGRDVAPSPLGPEDTDSVAAWAERARARGSYPRVYPMVDRVVEDELGNAWIWRKTAEGAVVDIFDQEGRFLGTLESPPISESGPPPSFRDAKVAMVSSDEFGVPVVTTYRVDRLGGASLVMRRRSLVGVRTAGGPGGWRGGCIGP